MLMVHPPVQTAMIRTRGGNASVEEIPMPVNLITTVVRIAPLEETKETQERVEHYIQLVMSLTIGIMETIANETTITTIQIGETTPTTTITTISNVVVIETINITTATAIKAIIHIRAMVVGLLQRSILGILHIQDSLQCRTVVTHMILRLLEDIMVILKPEAGKELLHLIQDIRHMETTPTDTTMVRTMHHLLLAVIMVHQLDLPRAQELVMGTVAPLQLPQLNMRIMR